MCGNCEWCSSNARNVCAYVSWAIEWAFHIACKRLVSHKYLSIYIFDNLKMRTKLYLISCILWSGVCLNHLRTTPNFYDSFSAIDNRTTNAFRINIKGAQKNKSHTLIMICIYRESKNENWRAKTQFYKRMREVAQRRCRLFSPLLIPCTLSLSKK